MSRHICVVENGSSGSRVVTKRIAADTVQRISLLESRVYCGCKWAMLRGAAAAGSFPVGPRRALCLRELLFFFRTDAMLKPFQIRVAVVLLAGFTLAAAILASLNFAKEGSFSLPTDQVSWVEAPGGLKAQRVLKDGPGRAGRDQGRGSARFGQ